MSATATIGLPRARPAGRASGACQHVAFGFGVYQCLGQQLARMELQVVYSTRFRRVPGLRLATELADVPFKHDAFNYGVRELGVTWRSGRSRIR